MLGRCGGDFLDMHNTNGPEVSHRARGLPQNAIRHLVPLAEAAEARGIKVHRLNIGQPDIATPAPLRAPLHGPLPEIFGYGKSAGETPLREAIAADLGRMGASIEPEEVIVTSGASEALIFAVSTLCDPGDEILTPDPTYANYLGFCAGAGVSLRPLPTFAEHDWALPDDLEAHLTGRTRAIMLSNPGNPTGAFYGPEALTRLLRFAEAHNLWLIVDEVYRELVFGATPAYSALALDDPTRRVVVVESTSKRYSTCGLRIGALITRNPSARAVVMSMAQARLSCSVLAQRMVAQISALTDEDRRAIIDTYRARLALVHRRLAGMKDVHAPPAEGAFYQMATLPVRDAAGFVRFMVERFEYEGHTTLVTPAAGFFLDPSRGQDQIRIACVLGDPDLDIAMTCIERGLDAYRAAFPNG